MKKLRPKVLGGITVKAKTSCGNMYIQMNWCDGVLFEVFATLGSAGGCATCQSEAVTRSVTLGLRSGVPVNEFIEQLRGLRCPSPMPFPKEEAVHSCPDALGKALVQYGNLSVEEVMKLILQANDTAVVNEEEERTAVAAMQELARVREEQGL